MEKTTLKIIETLRQAESNNPELALSSLRMASRLAGGSLVSWLESLVAMASQPRNPVDVKLEDEIKTLKEEIDWLGLMLRGRNDDIKSLKKEIERLKKEPGAFFDDKEPQKLEIERLKAELQDAKQALGLLTNFVDGMFKDIADQSQDDATAQEPH
ncbi:MAG TPA: hypothetical protein VE954_08730 [Oligoflexus sp.]|uniref:hypothetical protein n=1 Tax=Oligoflexus sp. TaxID=1971216 RepID=UPI002D222DDD|nr:hypothetical protein [Oligoflexus sp.]HYX33187.1 hypothetical protein [Oligoflexus sp.]